MFLAVSFDRHCSISGGPILPIGLIFEPDSSGIRSCAVSQPIDANQSHVLSSGGDWHEIVEAHELRVCYLRLRNHASRSAARRHCDGQFRRMAIGAGHGVQHFGGCRIGFDQVRHALNKTAVVEDAKRLPERF